MRVDAQPSAVRGWTAQFPPLAALEDGVRDRLERSARIVHHPEGARLFGPGQPARDMLLLLSGRARVQQTSEGGREIVLFRVHGGESCVLTTACMLAEEAYQAEGIAETDIVVVVLPKLSFDALVAEEPAFRNFVFAAYSRRLIDLLRVVDDVAFGRIDVRLAERLLALAGGDKEIAATHAQIASELGTAREVVSRVLHDFQKRGFVAQSRGRIAVLDKPALRALADAD